MTGLEEYDYSHKNDMDTMGATIFLIRHQNLLFKMKHIPDTIIRSRTYVSTGHRPSDRTYCDCSAKLA